jgi:hypothetical protein
MAQVWQLHNSRVRPKNVQRYVAAGLPVGIYLVKLYADVIGLTRQITSWQLVEGAGQWGLRSRSTI